MARNRRFQQGSLFKRGSRTKVWVARWWEEVTGTGGKSERIRRSEILGAVAEIPTRREAEQILSDRLRLINSGGYRPPSTWTLKSFVQDRWLPEVLPTLKYSTKLHYEYIVNTHLVPQFGDMQLRLITREAVQSFLAKKLCTGLSWKTVKHIRTTFGTILRAAEADDLLSDNPVLKTRLPRRGPIAEKASMAPEKLVELLDALPEPSQSLAWLLALTGLRIGELLALRWRMSISKAAVFGFGKLSTRASLTIPRPGEAEERFLWATGESRSWLAVDRHGSTLRPWSLPRAGQHR